MGRIRDLMKLLDIDEETAEQVLRVMECTDLDFSECTQAEFNRTARESLVEVTEGGGEYGYAEQKNFD